MEEVINVSRYGIEVCDTADYWIHRKVGTQKYFQYILPPKQKPVLAGGELVGPLCKREAVKFLLEVERKSRLIS